MANDSNDDRLPDRLPSDERSLNRPQPAPLPIDPAQGGYDARPPIWPMVVADLDSALSRGRVHELVALDMTERDAIGRVKYRQALTGDNGRAAEIDAYQEILDFCVYMRQKIWEHRDEVSKTLDVYHMLYCDGLGIALRLREHIARARGEL